MKVKVGESESGLNPRLLKEKSRDGDRVKVLAWLKVGESGLNQRLSKEKSRKV